jgi:hypothetical protein
MEADEDKKGGDKETKAHTAAKIRDRWRNRIVG